MSVLANDSVVWDDWHPVAGWVDFPVGRIRTTTLLDTPIAIARIDASEFVIWADPEHRCRNDTSFDRNLIGSALPVTIRYGHVWTSLGNPIRPLFAIPEAGEPDRRSCDPGSIGVHTGGLRAIENFLDLAHFPFVHAGILGAEPDTAVSDYRVDITADNEVLATECRFVQPQAALNAPGATDVRYIYRVPRPYSAILYKTCPPAPERFDVIALFVQPVTEERCIAHQWLCMLDATSSDADLRQFQLTIFGQDKPILENHMEKHLPLDPRTEMPVRADATSTAYRRWLSRLGLRYGAIPRRQSARGAD
ncbi:MAG: aromatic ring-hydroxylating dioxygenase subunit alpha [Burkholderiales bacterium]